MATTATDKLSPPTAPESNPKGSNPPPKPNPTSLAPMKKVFTIDKKTEKLTPVEETPVPASSESAPVDTTEPATNEDTSVPVEVVVGLTSAQRTRFVKLRKVVRVGLSEMNARSQEVSAALHEILDKKLYREHHGKFEEFCAAEFHILRSHAYALAGAGGVQQDLQSAMADKSKLPTNERQLRPLTKLKTPELRVQAWQRTLDLAKDGPVTEALVRKAVGELLPAKPKRLLAPTLRQPAVNWNLQMTDRFQAMGFEKIFEQPFKWPTDAASLFSLENNRYVKFVETLNFNEAACVLALKEKEPSCLIVVDANANAPDGLLYTTGEQPEIDKDSFAPAFHVMAKQCGVMLESEGKFYRASESDASFEASWAPVSYLDLELPEPPDEPPIEPEANE